MAQQPKEKLDFSSLPRAAISIKGLPVSRNTRLPSIRSPRDLTLGATPKRTFMPNIPVRREKKPQRPENTTQIKQEIVKGKGSPLSDRAKGRGRGRGQIIQTQGSIFSGGISVDPALKKEKVREIYQRSSRVFVKKEKDFEDVGSVRMKMDQLLRDDFIDDGDDDEEECGTLLKPIIFPSISPSTEVKNETKIEVKETVNNFDPNIAKEMDFDINRVAKFIKKEKGVEVDDAKQSDVLTSTPSHDITKLFNENSTKLLLIQFPEFVTVDQKMDDLEPSHKKPTTTDLKNSENQNVGLSSINSLPEGYIGKLQILKSGKTRLLIGPVEFTLDSLHKLKSKHEVVSIDTNSNPGDLTVLGHVQEKLKFVPNEDCLLA